MHKPFFRNENSIKTNASALLSCERNTSHHIIEQEAPTNIQKAEPEGIGTDSGIKICEDTEVEGT